MNDNNIKKPENDQTHLHIGIVARDKGLKTGDLYQIKSDMEKGGIHSETVAKSIAHLAENAEPKR